jgi:predicted phosphodiesterase
MRIGLCSDAHGNLEAFERTVRLLRREGAEQLFFLGDAVGYLPGHAVVEAVRTCGAEPLLGNHEAMLLCGAFSGNDEVYRLAETRAAMPEATLQYLGGWPVQRTLELEGRSLLMLHGSPSDPVYGYVYPDTSLDGFEAPAGAVVFMGNTHRPFVRESGGAVYVNLGSCGLPRDHGDLGAACLYDSDSGQAEIVRFDIREQTRQALIRCGPVALAVQAVFDRREPEPPFGRLLRD